MTQKQTTTEDTIGSSFDLEAEQVYNTVLPGLQAEHGDRVGEQLALAHMKRWIRNYANDTNFIEENTR